MDSYRQKLLEEYTDSINKPGMGIKELYDLRNRMIEVVEDDYEKTSILGLDELSQQRGNFKYGTQFTPDVDDIPSSIQEVKSDLAKLKTIMIDPSATVEGAQHIVDYMSKYAGRELTPKETTNLVKILGRAQKKGMKSTKELMYGKTSFEDIVAMVEKDKMTDDEIDEIAEKISNQYAEDVGLGIKKAPPSIVRPTPHIITESGFESETSYSINVDSPYKFETEKTNNADPKEKTNNTNYKDKKVKVKSISINRNTANNRKTSSVKVTNKKVRLSENSVHKSRGKRPHTTKSKTRRDY